MTWKDYIIRALKGGGDPIDNISRNYAIYCALMLTTVSILDQADKWALPTLQISGLQCSSCGGSDESFTEKCNSECLDITDSEMGFLLGPAFSLTSVCTSIPFGYLADRVKRVRILLFGLILWSLATLCSAFVQNFRQLAILRMILGVGAAAVNPTAFSLLSDYFNPSYRSIVMSIFQSTVYIGQDLGLLTGILSQETSWRLVFILLGSPGILIGIPFFLSVWEPKRGSSEIIYDKEIKLEENEEEISEIVLTDDITNTKLFFDDTIDYSNYTIYQKIIYLISMPTFISMWISASFRFMAGYALGSWIQVFYRRVFGLSPTTISLWLAVVIPLGGLPASYIGGAISDGWKKHLASANAWVLSLCSLLAIPFVIGTLYARNYQISFIFLLLEYLFAEMWLGPAITIIQDISPPNLRSISSAIYFLSLAVGGFSPYLLGWMIEWFAIDSPYQDPSEESYNPTLPLLIVVGGCYFISAIGFAITGWLIQLRYRKLQLNKIM